MRRRYHIEKNDKIWKALIKAGASAQLALKRQDEAKAIKSQIANIKPLLKTLPYLDQFTSLKTLKLLKKELNLE